ncbi:MAG: tRNA (adenosine(37)-N6)-threonylcarbamoyltransferase complex ATPase subunit type 1 TsaE [Actinomycetes bacterium]
MRDLGARLGGLMRAGDLVVLSGDLGAGKTTLTQGLGATLGVRGPVTSPTFVIARVHPSQVEGPPLVHVDAYRLSGWDELEDLDLEASLDEAVTVVEWGRGLVEGLAADRLELVLRRGDADAAGDAAGNGSGGVRTVELSAHGARWRADDLRRVSGSGPPAPA